ncbi:MAG TPA: phage tail protein [Rummeliibacillus sp.]|nr:phage tail protein [Rummeliibacillus sp.]
MSKIGSFGGITFQVSEKNTLTFRDYQRSSSARWNTSEISYRKPKKEFDGPGLENITITVILSGNLGVNPENVLKKWRDMRDKGKVGKLIIGNKPITNNYFSLNLLDESDPVIDEKGNFWKVTATLTLEEYEKSQSKIKKKTIKKKSSTTAKSKKNKLGTIQITTKSVHIRSGPGVNHRVVGYVFNGDKLSVYKKSNGWFSLGNGKYITSDSAYSKFTISGRRA